MKPRSGICLAAAAVAVAAAQAAAADPAAAAVRAPYALRAEDAAQLVQLLPTAAMLAAGGAVASKGSAGGAAACAGCHPVGGGGAFSPFPNLAGQPAWYLYKQLKDFASGDRQNALMSPFAKLMTDQERMAVALYYAAANVTPPPKPAQGPMPAALQRGQALLEHGDNGKSLPACDNCHGPAASGLPPSGPALSGQSALYLKSQFAAWSAGTRHNDSGGIMQGIGAKLAAEDVDAVASYAGTLRRLPK